MTCDECGQAFSPTPRERPTDDGGVLVYSECPACGAEYRSAIISPQGVQIRSEMRCLKNLGRGKTTDPRYRDLLSEYKDEVRRA